MVVSWLPVIMIGFGEASGQGLGLETLNGGARSRSSEGLDFSFLACSLCGKSEAGG